MIRWLMIESTPPRQVHDAPSRPYIDVAERADEILAGLGTRRSDINGSLPNVTASLKNRGYEASRAFATDPPIGVRVAVLARRGAVTFERDAGIVDVITLSDDGASLGIEA